MKDLVKDVAQVSLSNDQPCRRAFSEAASIENPSKISLPRRCLSSRETVPPAVVCTRDAVAQVNRLTLNNSRIVPQHTSFSLISDFVRESRLPSRYAKSKKQSTMAVTSGSIR